MHLLISIFGWVLIQIISFVNFMYLNLFLTSIFLDMSQIQLLIPFLAKLQAQKIITILAIIGLVSDSSLRDNIKKSLNSRHGRLLMLLIFWIIISIPFGVYPGHSFTFITQNFWKLIVMLCLVLAYIKSREDLEKLIWV